VKLADFTLDAETGLLLAPGDSIPAGYLDGSEQHLVTGMRELEDRSIGSEELAGLVTDWPTQYHLSPFRTTLFDAIGLNGDSLRVLELGCGCGAITRWLGERGADVQAIEGSPARALVARTRCADLSGVTVHVGNFSQLDERDAFDVVTLIGVLEYAHLYHPTERGRPAAAALSTLQQAAAALHRDGLLVLAIENQLGIKYLNGAREDHSGVPYDGIQGYPDPGRSAVTFSARVLERLLSAAGFAEHAFLLPFPDYKLAATIVDPAACDDEDRIHNWLDGPAPDRGAVRARPPFNELLAQRELARAGLLRDVANSFLVLAWRDATARTLNRAAVDLGWKAQHFSLDRRRDFRKRVTLVGDRVEHAPVVPAGERPEADAIERVLGLRQTLGSEPFRRGELLLYGVLETIAAHGLGPAFVAHVAELRAWVIDAFAVPSAIADVPLVRGAAYDATWWNLVVEPETRDWQLIDREWEIADALPADYVVWRSLFHFALRYGTLIPPAPSPAEFADTWLRAAVPGLADWLPQVCKELDAAYGGAVVRGPLPAAEPASLGSLRELAAPAGAVTVLARADEVVALPGLLAAFAGEFGAGDAITLVLLVAGDVAVAGPQVEVAMRAAAIDGPDGPDVVLMPGAGDAGAERALATAAVAVLSEREQPGALGALPRFGAGDVAALRDAARHGA